MSSVFLVATELKRPLPRVSLITKTPLVGLPSVSPLKREGEVGRDTSKFKITSKFLSTFGLGVLLLRQKQLRAERVLFGLLSNSCAHIRNQGRKKGKERQ